MTHLPIRTARDIDARDRHDRTALWEAADSGCPSVVRLLLADWAEVDFRDSFFGMTPLLRAVRAGSSGSVFALLEAGADPRAPTEPASRLWTMADDSNRPELRAILLRFDPRST